MPNTKDFVPVSQVRDGIVALSDGSIIMVIQTSAVNFDLLSENEQLAIIGSFAALLNSLSFSIQILIRSKKLDISHYLRTLKEAESKQMNPLLQLMMQRYRAFVAAIIRDNEVLDKQFYVILAVSPIELGIVSASNIEKNLQKALNILEPRRDHILKQLSRIGLKSDQLDDERLIKLFYDIYNDEDRVTLSDLQNNPVNKAPQKAEQVKITHTQTPQSMVSPFALSTQAVPVTPKPFISQQQVGPGPISNTENLAKNPPPAPTSPPVSAPVAAPQARSINPLPSTPPLPATPKAQPPLYSSTTSSNRTPFIVEELPDEFNHP